MQTPLKGAYVLHFILVVYKVLKRGAQTWPPATTRDYFGTMALQNPLVFNPIDTS